MNDRHPGFADCFRPPDIPTEVGCLHCGETYESYLIEWRTLGRGKDAKGFWCCPTPGCDGAGFLFDIYPTDPDWRDEHGEKVGLFDDEDEGDDECDTAAWGRDWKPDEETGGAWADDDGDDFETWASDDEDEDDDTAEADRRRPRDEADDGLFSSQDGEVSDDDIPF